jgi:hypothetical protein
MKGEIGYWVKICGNIGCQVCMWGNYQRNPRLLKRQDLQEESTDEMARKKRYGDHGGEEGAGSTMDGA